MVGFFSNNKCFFSYPTKVQRLELGLESNNLPTDRRKYNSRPADKSKSVDAFMTYMYFHLAACHNWQPFLSKYYFAFRVLAYNFLGYPAWVLNKIVRGSHSQAEPLAETPLDDLADGAALVTSDLFLPGF